ncbi:hypothetical protein K443DRAFT_637738 [Laccaria amethystina LaAM-08-1]|uniref:Uncharacterized protein n=1 Tax=Laccaria amethystina LaAM-08-1 TaxID=1095629 RepID=A0A0C9WUB0_9AGAR|nr:hypothetical protein K443DRAFT_637738 [Laccaria amethystina LaAM-08-1]
MGPVSGFIWNRDQGVERARELAQKVKRWIEEDEIEREADERRRMGRRWADCPMDIDNDTADDSLFEESDNEGGSEEIKTLKECRYLKQLLQSALRRHIPTTHERVHLGKKSINKPLCTLFQIVVQWAGCFCCVRTPSAFVASINDQEKEWVLKTDMSCILILI